LIYNNAVMDNWRYFYFK